MSPDQCSDGTCDLKKRVGEATLMALKRERGREREASLFQGEIDHFDLLSLLLARKELAKGVPGTSSEEAYALAFTCGVSWLRHLEKVG